MTANSSDNKALGRTLDITGNSSAGDPRRWWILANVSVGTFMANLDSSIASIALPTLAAEFDVSMTVIQWVMSAYLLTICALLPIAGKLSDQYGIGRLYNIGFFIFALGSVFSALSVSVGMLIASKVFQAFGAVFVMANTQGIVAMSFSPEQRGRALGITGISVSLGALCGPAIGGVLIDHFGWPSIFWINVPIGLIGFAAGLWILPKERPDRNGQRFDYFGSALFIVGITGLMYSISSAETHGWASWPIVGGLIGSFAVLVLMYLWETRIPNPMLDFSLYRIRMFLMGSIAQFCSVVGLYFPIIIMPFYLQDFSGVTPAVTGYVMASYPLTMAIMAPLAGWLSDRIGSYVLTTGGLIINALGFAALTFLSPGASLWLVAAHVAVFGVGHGLFQPSNLSAVLGSVPRAKMGLAGGLNALTRNLAMMTGVSVSVTLFMQRLQDLSGEKGMDLGEAAPEAFMGALDLVFWVGAGICVAGAVVSSLRGKAQEQKSSVTGAK